MNQYIIIYLGGDRASSPAEGKEHFAKCQQWLASLANTVIKPMVPYGHSHIIAPDGTATPGSAASLSGHTVIRAESIEAAVEIARSCPFLETNGSLEVAELVEIPA